MNKKPRMQYVCTSCGTITPSWSGQCHACHAWNTLEESVEMGANPRREATNQLMSVGFDEHGKNDSPISIDDVQAHAAYRIKTSEPELDRVLGGGIVPGSLILLGGQPGIGKSTLLLQIAGHINSDVLYISGEESMTQIKDRANRLEIKKPNLYLLNGNSLEDAIKQINQLKPELVIVDSVQTMYTDSLDSSPGSVTQLRECANVLMRYAKRSNIPIMLIGHITKDGAIGGPKVLEHIVDVVLMFEGDKNFHYRILRGQKNRFGSVDDIGLFEMKTHGLQAVENPAGIFRSELNDVTGHAISAVVEGQKCFLIEVQALVTSTVYGQPQRSPNGFDLRRMQMLLAVLEKRLGYPYSRNDVFLNITGGIKSTDPAVDLAVMAAAMSSFGDRTIPNEVCFAGEVGLSGEIRPVRRLEIRINEADRMGFKQIFVPQIQWKEVKDKTYQNIEIVPLRHIAELNTKLFQN